MKFSPITQVTVILTEEEKTILHEAEKILDALSGKMRETSMRTANCVYYGDFLDVAFDDILSASCVLSHLKDVQNISP